MRECDSPKTRWWPVYILVPLAGILLYLQHAMDVPSPVHEIMEMGIMFIAFLGLALWMHGQKAKLVGSDPDPLVIRRVPKARSVLFQPRTKQAVTFISIGALSPLASSELFEKDRN